MTYRPDLPRLAAIALAGSVAFAATAANAAPIAHAVSPGHVTQAAARTANAAPIHPRAEGLYRRAQEKLKRLGIYAGEVDGARNATYVQALERFQRAHNLYVTGRLSAETRAALHIA